MLTDKDLLELNQKGLFPGPKEDEKIFSLRVESCQKIYQSPEQYLTTFPMQDPLRWHEWDWARSTLVDLFDICPDWIVSVYSKKQLSFFQGAATWIFDFENNNKMALIQLQPQLKTGRYLKYYDRDEILSHEAIHVTRMAFDDEKTEEIFAYLTSSNTFRKIFGPVFRKPSETYLVLGVLLVSILLQLFYIHTSILFVGILSWVFQFLSLTAVCYGLFRLFFVRRKFFKTYKKLSAFLKSRKKARAVLFRLTDSEIFSFSKKNDQAILEYINEKKRKEFRWRVLNLAYFKVFDNN